MTMGTSIRGLLGAPVSSLGGVMAAVRSAGPGRQVGRPIDGRRFGDGRLVLEMWQRRMLRVLGKPSVHDPLDHPAAAQRAADEGTPALRGEVAGQALVARVALATLRDLGIDV